MNGNKPLVLLYHQICDQESKLLKNFNISISPKLFNEHMKILKEYFKPITFSEWNYSVKNNIDIKDRIIVTFDDGYRDAINYGTEILSNLDLDALWFINSGFVNNNKVFWLSKLMHLLNTNVLEDFIEKFLHNYPFLLSPIDLKKLNIFEIDLWAKDNYNETLLKEIDIYLNTIKWNEEYEAAKHNLYANKSSLNKISEYFTLGNHTLSHPNFRNLSIEKKVEELEDSRLVLEKITNKNLSCFAFPFGEEHFHWCQNDIKILNNLNYNYIFTVSNKYPRLNNKVINRYEIKSMEPEAFKNYVIQLYKRDIQI